MQSWLKGKMFAKARISNVASCVYTQRLRSLSSVRQIIEERVRVFPSKSLFRFFEQDISWNTSQVKQHSEAVAAGLLQLGFRPGDSTIATCLDASAESVGVSFGSALIGVQVAQMDGLAKSAESLKTILKETNCRGIVIPPETIPLVYETIPDLLRYPPVLDSTLSLEEFPHLRYIYHTGHHTFRGMHRFKDMLVYYPVEDLEEVEVDSSPILSAVDANGKKKEAYTLNELLSKGKELSEGSSDENAQIVYASKSISPSLTIGCIASLFGLSKIIVPSRSYSDEHISKVLEVENCDFAFGDTPPAGLKTLA